MIIWHSNQISLRSNSKNNLTAQYIYIVRAQLQGDIELLSLRALQLALLELVLLLERTDDIPGAVVRIREGSFFGALKLDLFLGLLFLNGS